MRPSRQPVKGISQSRVAMVRTEAEAEQLMMSTTVTACAMLFWFPAPNTS